MDGNAGWGRERGAIGKERIENKVGMMGCQAEKWREKDEWMYGRTEGRIDR